jgi:sulfur relay (sulfurtransferase) complex TusBCD TusD component (DsrE family)
VKVLVIVNQSPWGATLPVVALRLVRAMSSGGVDIDAVYFRGDGVYNALPGRATDAGTPNLAEEWSSLSESAGFALLLCSSASSRRLDCAPGRGFREAGLADVLSRLADCDRVVKL